MPSVEKSLSLWKHCGTMIIFVIEIFHHNYLNLHYDYLYLLETHYILTVARDDRVFKDNIVPVNDLYSKQFEVT